MEGALKGRQEPGLLHKPRATPIPPVPSPAARTISRGTVAPPFRRRCTICVSRSTVAELRGTSMLARSAWHAPWWPDLHLFSEPAPFRKDRPTKPSLDNTLPRSASYPSRKTRVPKTRILPYVHDRQVPKSAAPKPRGLPHRSRNKIPALSMAATIATEPCELRSFRAVCYVVCPPRMR